ncbi:MAG: insulinase family protein [Chitinophagaceae bacterium]|nr:insulinase family protein [Chitinophagaceae bacterium]
MKKLLIVAAGIFCLQYGIAQVKVDRSKKPAAGPAPVISIKDPVILNMPNGITVLVVENHKLPKVRASFFVDYGPVKEGKKAGLLDLMGQMLGEGTTNMPKDQFDEAVDMIGADINLNAAGGSASSLTRYFDKAFNLMADAIKNPSFPAESFDKLKSMTITGLKSEEKSTPTIATRVYTALSYGKNTAQGEFTTEETVKGLTVADVKEAYKNHITPSRSYLTFVGDITPAAAKALAEKAFGSWKGKKLSLPAMPLVQNPKKTEIDFVDIPTAVQGELRVGNVVNNPLNNKDYHALLLANYILGGGADSKLFMNLREKHGFTYGSYSRIGSGRFQSLFTATAAVRTDKVDSATSEMFKEILNMRDGKVSAEDLSNAKAKYNGGFALGMEDPAKTAEYASNILINGLPKDFYRTYLQKINGVTLADIKNVSKTYFSENNSRIVIAGNASKIIPKLMKFGYPIKKYDRYAEPVVEKPLDVKTNETPKTTENISAYEIINSYLKAVGGKEEIKKVTTVSATISLDMMGRTFTGNYKRMNPDKQLMELKMGAMTVMKSVFDGGQGYQMQGPQKNEMDEQEIKEARDEKGVIPQLFYATDTAYKTDYLGTGKAGEEATYRLKVTMPSGKVSVQEYSVKSGLLLKEESTSKEGDQEVTETVEYKNYVKVGAVLLPSEITRNVAGQEIPFKFTDYKLNEGVTEADFK